MAKNAIFVTGASGFIGRCLIGKLDPARWSSIYCLSRKAPPELARQQFSPRVRFLRGDLFDTAVYAQALAASDAVVHLAAAIGKAPRTEHFRVNLEGTRQLVGVCRQLGVERFLFVSSIAARFPKKTRYYYAQSKQQAEEVVRQSGLRFTIVRPTIVLGAGSPVWQGLAKLARLPVIPIFGDGNTRIQPIDVDDLAKLLAQCIDSDRFDNETLEFGGPETISMEEFLCRVHQHLCQNKPRCLHIPFGLVLPLLTLLEIPFYRLLPVTAGQLASFRCDGTIEGNSLVAQFAPRMKTIGSMLALLSSNDVG